MKASPILRIVAIALGVVALVLVGMAATAEPAAPRLVLLLAGVSAAITVVAMVFAERGRSR